MSAELTSRATSDCDLPHSAMYTGVSGAMERFVITLKRTKDALGKKDQVLPEGDQFY